MAQYEFAKQFCSDRGDRVKFEEPIIITRNGVKQVAASNCLCIVVFPEEDGSVAKCDESLEKIFNNVLDEPHLLATPKVINVSSIRDAFDRLDRVPEIIEEETECPDCDGEGEVECSECGHFHACGRCEGEGVIITNRKTDNMVVSLNSFVKIGDSFFRSDRINEILMVADYANVDVIYQTRGYNILHPFTFQIGKVEMLVMPSDIRFDSVDSVECK